MKSPIGSFKTASKVILQLIFLMLIVTLNIKTVNNQGLVIGGGLFIATIVLAALEGYKGMIISFLLNIIGAGASFLLLMKYWDRQYLILGYFQFCIGISCILIGWLSERHHRISADLKDMACRDYTTNAYNHRFFQEILRRQYSRAGIEKTSFSVILIDIDNFRGVNQAYGYAVGDIILKDIACVIHKNIHVDDVVSRYGGNEFAVILQNTPLEQAMMISERIKLAVIQGVSTIYNETEVISIGELSVSIGIACYPDTASNPVELIQQMDSALQDSKNLGRNKVNIFKSIFKDIEKMDLNGQNLENSLRLILMTINAKDHYTVGHSVRVSEYVCKMLIFMGFEQDQIQEFKIAALIHDIGKVEVPDYVLNKKGKLTELEFQEVQKHTVYGNEILMDIKGFEKYQEAALNHHERYDGCGYPNRILGDDIPLIARVISVADAFDAMISNRTYRKGMSITTALYELKMNAGKQFDPKYVEVLIAVLTEEIKSDETSLHATENLVCTEMNFQKKS